MLYEAIKEILSATHSLGIFPIVKVTGNEDKTEFSSVTPDKSVILSSEFKQSVPEFNGVFGLGDLGKLNTIVSIPIYKDNAQIVVNCQSFNDKLVPASILFENETCDFRNEFRLMNAAVIDEQVPVFTNRKPLQWNVEITPTQDSIQRLKYQSNAVGGSTGTFSARTSKGNLMLTLGEKSSHEGEFKFAGDVVGEIKTTRNWPLGYVQSILNMTGDKEMRILDAGAMEIKVSTELAIHRFMVMASTK